MDLVLEVDEGNVNGSSTVNAEYVGIGDSVSIYVTILTFKKL